MVSKDQKALTTLRMKNRGVICSLYRNTYLNRGLTDFDNLREKSVEIGNNNKGVYSFRNTSDVFR